MESKKVSACPLPNVLHVSTVHQACDIRIFHKEVLSLVRDGYNVAVAITVEKAAVKEGVPFVPLGKYGGPRWRRISRNIRALRAMLARDVDVVHIHDPELLVTVIPALLIGRKVIYDIHEFYYERILDSEWIWRPLRWAMAKLYAGLERILLPRFAAIVVVTDKMQEDYRNRFPGLLVTLVRNFPSMSEESKKQALAQGPPLDEEYVIHTGGASRLKCFDIMVATAEKLREDNIHAPIVNVGPIDLSTFSRKEQHDLLARAKRADVRLLGPLNYTEVLRWVSHARVGYLLRRDLPDARLGLPNKLFEYFALGIPVVATSVGLMEQIVREHKAGIAVPATDVVAHAAALKQLLTDDAVTRSTAMAAGRAARFFSFAAERERFLQLYDRVARQSNKLHANGFREASSDLLKSAGGRKTSNFFNAEV